MPKTKNVTASDASCDDENGKAKEPTNCADKPKTVEFKPYQVSKNVWEGRYTPTVNGKRIARNIYADSEEECEIKLEALIKEMKAEISNIKANKVDTILFKLET